MEFIVIQRGAVCLISPQGSIDALTAPEFTAALNAQIGAGRLHLVADLGAVDFMSSAGLRLLMQAAREARQKGGDLRLAAASPAVEKMLKMAGFTSVLKVFSDIEEAVSSYAS